MELLLFRPSEFHRLYNCSFYDVERIPATERRHPIVGLIFVIAYTYFFCAYSFCLLVMAMSDLRKMAAYKLMISLGIIHLFGLQTAGLNVGVNAIQGSVFCSDPIPNYAIGGLAVASWCSATLANLFLALNRSCELYSPKLSELLFGFPQILAWAVIPHLYMWTLYFITTPALFSAFRLAYFLNPHLGYFEDYGAVYNNWVSVWSNVVISCAEFVAYGLMIWSYRRRIEPSSPELRNRLEQEQGKRIYFQVLLIGLLHLLGGSFHLGIQFYPFSLTFNLIASVVYLLSQGAPVLIYLTMNHSIRNRVIDQIVGPKKRKVPQFVTTTAQVGTISAFNSVSR